jgi:hypothetical protein
MALLSRQNASGPTGATITFATSTAAGAGDTLAAGQSVHLLVNNTGTAALNVMLVTPEQVEGALDVADRAVTVAVGALAEIPVPSRYNDRATGLATVTFSAAVPVAVVQGSATP